MLAGCGPENDDEGAPADPVSAVDETSSTTATTEVTETTGASTSTTTPGTTTEAGVATTTTEAVDETTVDEANLDEEITRQDVGLVDEGVVFRPFADDSPWNTSVAGAELDARSNELLRRAATRVTATTNPAPTERSTCERATCATPMSSSTRPSGRSRS